MATEIKDSVVLVTGANRGIGKAIVEEAIARGARKVYAAVRTLSTAEPLKHAWGDKLVPVPIDITDRDSIVAAAKVADDVTIVINNAGVAKSAHPLAEHANDALHYEMKVNVHGLLDMAQAFAPVLAKNGGGAFVQLNSVVSLQNFVDFSTYSASKAASYSITQGLRLKLAEQNTQVVSVHPGPIKTDMAEDVGLGDIAEPPELVAQGIFEAIEDETFHVWPDSMAKQFGEAYESFANKIIEAAPAV